MNERKVWSSPDGRIKKEILKSGIFGDKPAENCICSFSIANVENMRNSVNSEYILSTNTAINVNLGESNTALDRELDKCLMTMHAEEISHFTIIHAEGETQLTLSLYAFESRGYIYEWSAKDKLLMTQVHKNKGVELYQQGRYVDASHRFSRGLKLLLSVPESVEDSPEEIDGISLLEIGQYRANLYNNLASCYLKDKNCDIVISLCTKVLQIDMNNVKALHKRGVARYYNREFDQAKDDFTRIIELEPNNKTANEKLQLINIQLNEQEAKYAVIVKKMFSK